VLRRDSGKRGACDLHGRPGKYTKKKTENFSKKEQNERIHNYREPDAGTTSNERGAAQTGHSLKSEKGTRAWYK